MSGWPGPNPLSETNTIPAPHLPSTKTGFFCLLSHDNRLTEDVAKKMSFHVDKMLSFF